MPRLLFEKTGNAVWISHLDLMRVFQRAFKRAGLPLTHTQGFNPRPSVSIALPLSVGVASRCELLDFDLDNEQVCNADILQRLNSVLIPGVQVLQVYDTGRKLKELVYLHCKITLEYDNGVPEVGDIRDLFARDIVIVPKKGKNGVQDQDIAPMIRNVSVTAQNSREVVVDCVICCQNPTLNPMQMVAAIQLYLPELKPDHAGYVRLEVLDKDMNVFR